MENQGQGNIILTNNQNENVEAGIYVQPPLPNPALQQPQPQPAPYPYGVPPPQPTYTVLPNGTVQVVYNMPTGYVPPSPAFYPTSQPPITQSPPVVYASPQYVSSAPVYVSNVNSPAEELFTAGLVTYIIGLFFFLPYLASIIIALRMVKKGYIHSSKAKTVRGLAIAELVFWILALVLSWLFTDYTCYSYCDYNYSTGINQCYDEKCEMWWGWVFLIVWWLVAIACGIPRVLYMRMRPN